MRLQTPYTLDHELIANVETDQHHPPTEIIRIAINSQALSAGDYYYRRSLVYSGHRVIQAGLRGDRTVDVQGHEGVFALGNATAGQSAAEGPVRSGYSGYVNAYVGGYSRMHGDTRISMNHMFGAYVYLKDIYIDTGTDEAVCVFNAYRSAYLKVWGTLVVK